MKCPEIFDQRMHDGSRHFADLPETYDALHPQWNALRDHLAGFAEVTGFMTDHVTEAWIDFRYRGQCFSANNQQGSWWLFVEDPSCDESILEDVRRHCARLLD